LKFLSFLGTDLLEWTQKWLKVSRSDAFEIGQSFLTERIIIISPNAKTPLFDASSHYRFVSSFLLLSFFFFLKIILTNFKKKFNLIQ
jgi:hypothetical protein